jgi:uncharacterized protein (DUF302 family)
MTYGYTKKSSGTFEEVVAKTKAALAVEGFGVLSEIDVKATMKKKLDVDFENYIILGACKPSFARQALESEKEIGLLLPCNVIVYEDKGDIFVSAILPSIAMSIVNNPALKDLASEVEDTLKRAIAGI